MSQWLWKLEQVNMPGRDRPRLRIDHLTIPRTHTAILGHSGAGKTTLLNLLVGYESPAAGRVVQNETNHSSLRLYWCPPDFGLWPPWSVAEHLQAVHGPDRGCENIREILSAFDLTDVASARPDHLSQGQRSRLAVARALASGAEVLVMDEPLVHVHPASLHRYWDYLLEQADRMNITLLFSTHDPLIACRYASHTICLQAGRVIASDATESLYHQPPSEDIAQCFGETNWLPEDETAIWFDTAPAAPQHLRPEQVCVEPSDGSPVQVHTARSGEVVLRHEPTGRTRRFVHRQPTIPVPGQRVRLRIVAAIALCLLTLLGGCDDSNNESSVPLEKFVVHPMFPDDVFFPKPRDFTHGPDNTLLLLDNGGRMILMNHKAEMVRYWRIPSNENGNPEGACLLADGRIALADTHYYRILFFDQQGNVLGEIGNGRSTKPGEFIYPVDIVQDPAGNLYVGEYGGNDRVQKFTVDGKFLTEFGKFGLGTGEFQRMSGLIWYDGHIYASDATGNKIEVFTDEGVHVRTLGLDLDLRYPYGITMDKNGLIYAIEWKGGRVTVLDTKGKLVRRFGSPGVEKGQFRTPWGVEVTDDGTIWVADTENHRIVEVRP